MAITFNRTIQSPGVEINEIDLSLYAGLPAGTNVLVNGFAAQGPTNELYNVTSISEFENIFGVPTNTAERYFYHTCKQVLQSPSNLLVTRMPYGSGSGIGFDGGYSALLYPVYGTNSSLSAIGGHMAYNSVSGLLIGEPTHIALDEATYNSWEAGSITWDTNSTALSTSGSTLSGIQGQAGFIVLNSIKTSVDNIYQGYYLGIADNTGFNTAAFDSITGIKFADSLNALHNLNSSQISFPLIGDNSLSESIEKIPTFDFTQSYYNDSVILGLYRLRSTQYNDNPNILTNLLTEQYTGSFNVNKKKSNVNGGADVSDFIKDNVNNSSIYMKVLVNPYLSTNTNWMTGSQVTVPIRVLPGTANIYALGNYTPTIGSSGADKIVGSIPAKLETALRLAENDEQIPLDIVCEGGLGTLWVCGSATNPGTGEVSYNEWQNFSTQIAALGDQTTGTSSGFYTGYNTIYNLINDFVLGRKDCMSIVDPLRHIFVQGEDTKVLDDVANDFSSDVYWPLKNLYASANSSYAATYGNWVKSYDSTSNRQVWLPMSGYVAAIVARVSANLQPWFAPAGLNNGILRDVLDLGVNPTQKQRDLLYRININPVVLFPGDGYTVWGQKTLQKKPSAFDRINVRRLFLVLEKATKTLCRYFVFEPNTVFTRTRLVNTLSPIFSVAKNNQGLYNFAIISDERNNSNLVIDNNELRVDIYIQPVKASEYILVSFISTRTGQSFEELV
jgi:hypothetical protein